MINKTISPEAKSKKFMAIAKSLEESTGLSFESILKMVKASDESILNKEKILLLKEKIDSKNYQIDIDEVGDAILVEIMQD